MQACLDSSVFSDLFSGTFNSKSIERKGFGYIRLYFSRGPRGCSPDVTEKTPPANIHSNDGEV
jgi:hypothetical protein